MKLTGLLVTVAIHFAFTASLEVEAERLVQFVQTGAS
jgi:hypothetical protein